MSANDEIAASTVAAESTHRTGNRVCHVVARHVVVVVDISLARIGLAERVVREGHQPWRARAWPVPCQAWLAASKVGAIMGAGRTPDIALTPACHPVQRGRRKATEQ